MSSYKVICEGFDWGPAITKVVLNLECEVDKESLSPEAFKVHSVRTYQGFDWGQFKPEASVTDHEALRKVTRAYLSDGRGKATSDGEFITLEMEVGPTIEEGSPFYMDFALGGNQMLEIDYRVDLTGQLKSADGQIITMEVTNAANCTEVIWQGSEGFIKDQPFVYEDISLNYAYYRPQTAKEAQGSNPLIIWLHGAGEGGKNTLINIYGNKVINLATDKIQKYFGASGAYILTPQSPTMWMDYNGQRVYNNTVEDSKGKSYYTQALIQLIDSFLSDHPEIDKSRVYLGGCSNGGYMTVNMLIEYPDRFAGAFPICEAYEASWLDDNKIERIKNIPIWLTASVTDPLVKVAEGEGDFGSFSLTRDEEGKAILTDSYSNALYNRLLAANAPEVHYTLLDKVADETGKYFDETGKEPYEYNGHFSWINALNDTCFIEEKGKRQSLFQWLSQQKKG